MEDKSTTHPAFRRFRLELAYDGRPFAGWQSQASGDAVQDLVQRALATVSFTADGVRYQRESFVSAADGVLAVRLAADRPRAVSFAAEFVSEQPGESHIFNDALRFDGRNRSEAGIAGQLRWAFEARISTAGGTVTIGRDHIRVDGADSALILVDIATSFRRFDDVSGDPSAAIAERLDRGFRKGWDRLLADHLDAHKALYDRFAIDLGHTPTADLATDERIAAFEQGCDPGLAALYVHFGRYLAISSSRPGTQPTNLQGIWNHEIRPPWGSKYTSNINLQMNYWLSDAANLGACVEPLLRMAEELAVTGAEMARIHYGARGWVLHHNTDLWRATGPVDGAQWGVWPTGGAWLCAQLWDHARFAGYPSDLVARLYPLLHGAAEFFLDTLVELPGTDHLVTAPSISPENVHSRGATICAGPAMDNQLLRDLFDATAAAATRLAVDGEFVAELMRVRARLPADRIGQAGQLQEWLEDWDLDVPEIHHRHVSHLYGVYPSLQINLTQTPQLAAAGRKSLELRGDDATGWGVGWRINLWARLGDGDSVRLSSVELSSLLRYGSPEWVPVGLTSPEIQMKGDTMLVAAIIPTDRIPSHPDLDRVRSLLPDSARVEVVGSVRTLDGGGRGALTVRQVEFAGIPIPERYYPPMLEQIGRGEEPGLAETEMALPLPSGVSEVRVEDGFLLLIP